MNFIKNIVDFLESVKGFTGRRFYFIVSLLFIFSVFYILKDPISDYIISAPIKIEFRECRNEQGLKSALGRIVINNKLVTSYALYLYQPKDKEVYKTCMLTDNKMLEMSPSLKYIYLKDQQTLNAALKENGYIIIQKNDNKYDTSILRDFDINAILIYKICGSDGIIGELMFSLKNYPSAYDLDILLREIGPLYRSYIL